MSVCNHEWFFLREEDNGMFKCSEQYQEYDVFYCKKCHPLFHPDLKFMNGGEYL